MSYSKPHIAILGAGPAGLGAAFQLARRQAARVTVLEERDRVGGNAGSFEFDGLHLDYGSHRLHPACDPHILQDLKELLGDDLLTRPRHGRIRLRDEWIHFPLKPLDLMLKLPPAFALGVFGDTILKVISLPGKKNGKDETFASLLESQLGKTICQEFYFPYARKIWGLAPEQLSEIQAQKRVSANSLVKMLKRVMGDFPHKVFSVTSKSRSNGRPYFYYPRLGFGQVSQAIYRAALDHGADIIFGAKVREVHLDRGMRDFPHRVKAVTYEHQSVQHTLQADYIWSTIPITILVRCLRPKPAKEVLLAARNMQLRAMILIYLVLEQDQFSEFDAHYFPGSDTPITRLSEPKNYSNAMGPVGHTALCAELPCDVSDGFWEMEDENLGRVVLDVLDAMKIPVEAPVRQVLVRRLRHAYPIYEKGFEQYLGIMDNFVGEIDGLLTFGRQGLFAHDNTHHALYMAYAAVDCLDEQGNFDSEKWKDYRKIFAAHVVED